MRIKILCILIFTCFVFVGMNPANAGLFGSSKSQNVSHKQKIRKKFSITDFLLKEEKRNNTQLNNDDYKVETLNIPEQKIHRQSSFKISVINPTVSNPKSAVNYPGMRGANMLVIYTPEYGIKTGTNEFGAEAIVVNDMVSKLSGADSLIPSNGYVISGHGTAKKWIQDNLILGSKIQIDTENMTVTASVTDETYIYEVNAKIKETESIIRYYKSSEKLYDYKKAAFYLSKADEYLLKAKKNPEKFELYLEKAKENADEALKNTIPYKADEFNGIWIRPVEESPAEIQNTVERLSETGIKNVFLETYYHGKTIYPSRVLQKYGVNDQNKAFTGFDPLKTWIEECHKKNIRLHIWFECFYVGNKNPKYDSKHILTIYPEWANTTKALADSDELAYSKAEHNGYFIDPANPDVQKFISEIIDEIICEYNPDGINLDYIRYPQCAYIQNENSTGTEWGYTKFAREEFKNLYGKDPVEIEFNDPLRQKWFEYRQQKITDLVEQTRKKTRKQNMLFTTVIFPDKKRSCETKLQDWKTWSDKNLVDGFTPLILTTDINTATSLLREIQNNTNSNIAIYPGIFVMFMNAAPSELLKQIHGMRLINMDGVIFFDYAHLYQKYTDFLTERVFNPKG